MHKNVYNFFIIFQYFRAFYGFFNAKFMLSLPTTKDETLEPTISDYIMQS